MRLLLITLIALTAMPALAQVEDQIAGVNRKGGIVLLNNRSYEVDKGALIESFTVSGEAFLNIFDFENDLVYHKTPQTNQVLETTSFKSMDKTRIAELTSNAAFFAIGVAAQCMFAAETWT